MLSLLFPILLPQSEALLLGLTNKPAVSTGSRAVARAAPPCMAASLIENVAPLLVLPVVFIGAQSLAEMGGDKIAPGVDLEPKTAEELAKDPPKPLLSFLPDWVPKLGSGDQDPAPMSLDTGKDFYAPRVGEQLDYFPMDGDT